MSLSVPRTARYAEIEALPPHVVGEVLGGELVASRRGDGRHTKASTTLGILLGGPFQLKLGGPGGWWFADEPELSLGVDPGFDPVVPDLAGWRRETMAEFPVTPQFHMVPDWVCEVSSPSTQRLDRVLKLPFYARAGVGHVWIVEPQVRTLEVFRLVEGRWRLVGSFGGEVAVRAEPFEAVEVPLGALWVG